MRHLGLVLIAVGITATIVGACMFFGISWPGRLPGDIRIVKSGSSVFIPVATCIVLSVIITILLNIFR